MHGGKPAPSLGEDLLTRCPVVDHARPERSAAHESRVAQSWSTKVGAAAVSHPLDGRIVETAFYDLDAPPRRVCSAEVPVPYAKHLEQAAIPQVETIVSTAWDRRSVRVGMPHVCFRVALSRFRPGRRNTHRLAGQARRRSRSRAGHRDRRHGESGCGRGNLAKGHDSPAARAAEGRVGSRRAWRDGAQGPRHASERL